MSDIAFRADSSKGKTKHNLFSAHKRRKQLSIVFELSDEIETLERTVNNSYVPVPNITDRIQELKDRLEIEVEKEDFERANKDFAKRNL